MPQPQRTRPLTPAEMQAEAECERLAVWLADKIFRPVVIYAEAMGWDYIEDITFGFTSKDGLTHRVSQGRVNIEDLKRAIAEVTADK